MNKIKTSYKKEIAESYDEKRFDNEAGRLIHEQEKGLIFKAAEKLGLKKGARVCEVGCGTGRVLLEMALKNYSITGIEPSEHMLVQASKSFEKQGVPANFKSGSLDNIPEEDETFDMVYSVRVLNQTESAEYALNSLEEFARVLKPGGGILVEFMNYHRRGIETKKVLLGDGQNTRERTLNVRLRPSEVETRLRDLGLTVVWTPGIFLMGMTSYYAVPDALLGLVNFTDTLLSKIFPRLCSRCYVLAVKN